VFVFGQVNDTTTGARWGTGVPPCSESVWVGVRLNHAPRSANRKSTVLFPGAYPSAAQFGGQARLGPLANGEAHAFPLPSAPRARHCHWGSRRPKKSTLWMPTPTERAKTSLSKNKSQSWFLTVARCPSGSSAPIACCFAPAVSPGRAEEIRGGARKSPPLGPESGGRCCRSGRD